MSKVAVDSCALMSSKHPITHELRPAHNDVDDGPGRIRTYDPPIIKSIILTDRPERTGQVLARHGALAAELQARRRWRCQPARARALLWESRFLSSTTRTAGRRLDHVNLVLRCCIRSPDHHLSNSDQMQNAPPALSAGGARSLFPDPSGVAALVSAPSIAESCTEMALEPICVRRHPVAGRDRGREALLAFGC